MRKNNGVSHFLEHMLFKGTQKRPTTLDIAETLDKVGGDYNAFTDKEYTGYWAKVDNKHLDLALDWVSDIFLNSVLDSEEINREKGVIIEEINMYLDTPIQYIGDVWEELLYGDCPAGWNIAGSKENVSKMTRNNFVQYLNERYLANNTVVVIAGNIKEIQGIRKKAQNYFKNIKLGKSKGKNKVIEKQENPQVLINYKKTDQTHFYLGFRTYNIFDKRKYALSLLSAILGGNMSSRIWISVRERHGLGYYIRTTTQSYTDTGYLATRAGVDNTRVELAIKLILDEYKKISKERVSIQELKKAKDFIKGSTILNLESSDSIASFFGGQEILTNNILTLKEKFAKIEAVTVDDIYEVANDIFKPEKLNLALIGPFKDRKKFERLLKI